MNTQKLIAAVCALSLTGNMFLPMTASAVEYEEMLEMQTVSSADDVVSWLNAYGEIVMSGFGYPVCQSEYTVPDYQVIAAAPEQRKFDLRNVNSENYITSVKDQGHFGSGWSQAVLAACEGSMAYEMGDARYSEDGGESPLLDLSERHLAWFVYQPLGENPVSPDQQGEGVYLTKERELAANSVNSGREYNEIAFGLGVSNYYSAGLFSNFIGPSYELLLPYNNDEDTPQEGIYYLVEFTKDPTEPGLFPDNGLMDVIDYITDASMTPHYYTSEEELEQVLAQTKGKMDLSGFTWYQGEGTYLLSYPLAPSTDGTWAVDEAYRFAYAAEVEDITFLPYLWFGPESDGYSYDFQPDTLNAFKNELVNGRPVVVKYYERGDVPSVQSVPGTFTTFLDENWNPVTDESAVKYTCHYTYCPDYDPEDPESANSIMDYYINHSVTIVGYDDDFPKEAFYDPNGTIGGNGAFIVKDSRGTEWGDGGYFYISYYDQSLSEAVSYNFNVKTPQDRLEEKLVGAEPQIYDFRPTCFYNELNSIEKASMANVFEASADTHLRTVGYTSVTNNEEIEYQIYLLDKDAGNPTDGELAATVRTTAAFSGYHTTNLEQPVFLKKGQRYSVVVTARREDGSYGIALHPETNEAAKETVYQQQLNYIDNSEMSDRMEQLYIDELDKSFRYKTGIVNPGESFLMTGGTWTDLADINQRMHSDANGQYVDIDNFSIKAISDSEILTVSAEPELPEQELKVGDTITIHFTVTNNSGESFDSILLGIGESETLEIGSMEPLAAVQKDYVYTLTEDDLQKQSAVFDVHAYLENSIGRIELMLFDETSSTAVTLDLHPKTQETTESTEPKPLTNDQLSEYSCKDYAGKNGTAPASTSVTQDKDGSVSVVMYDASGNVLDTYKLDPLTGKGTNASGAAVDLPQTGNNDHSTATAAAGAGMLTMTGLFMLLRSFGSRKRKDTE